jgi:putative membrane protein
MPKSRLGALALTVFVVSGCSTPFGIANLGGETSSLNAADRGFISQAAYSGLAEVELGQLAREKSTNARVTDFGRMMVEEHTQANQDLVNIATSKGITPPTSPDPGRRAVSDMLAELSGPDFDRQYIPQQLADHEVALTLFEGQAERGQDVELRQFARRYQPVIQRHVEMLRRMSNQVVSSN